MLSFFVSIIIKRNATHCISPYAIVVCVCMCMCLCVCLCVYVCVCAYAAFVDLGKQFNIETSSCFKLRGITPDIICKFDTNRITNSNMTDKMAAVKHYCSTNMLAY